MSHDHEEHEHDLGLTHDLPVMSRRKLIVVAGGAAAVGGLAFAGSASAATTSSTSKTMIPEETAGPYPGDGSNGVNVLTSSGIVRKDIRSSFGSSTTKAAGVPLTIKLLLRKDSTKKAVSGLAVYLWHCNRDGLYSLYSAGLTKENYLRGVQATSSTGYVTFTSIYPACYDGRWPHIHFEVYPSVAKATSSSNKLHTSQIALPADVCAKVYATTGYAKSKTNLAKVSLKTDNVFSDGTALEMASVTGSVAKGYTATLTVNV